MRTKGSLHILHVTPYYREAWGYGGIPRVVTSVCRGLVRLGHRVTVCTTDARDAHSRTDPGLAGEPVRDKDGVEVHTFPNVSNHLAYHQQFFMPLGLRRYLRQHGGEFDVAHLHGYHHLPGSIAAAELGRASIPYVVAPNGTAPRIERRRVAKWVFDNTIGRDVLAGARRVVAVTEAEKRQLERLGVPPALISIVPNPVDVEAFSNPPPRGNVRRLGTPFECYVLYLGKMTPRKGVELLVEAFARLRRPGLGLVIAGNDMGSGASIRRVVRELNLEESVRFAGQLEGRERVEAFVNAEVVAYPGSDEIFGLVPLEAILCGTPVVVGDDSGCGEVIEKVGGGRVVSQGNVDALTDAIRAVMEERLQPSFTLKEARDRIERLFSCKVVAAALEEIYHDLVEDSSISEKKAG
jgi:glycosyltransferase involved in cell wall biosynthesis